MYIQQMATKKTFAFLWLFLLVVFCAGCTPEKARAIKIAATQFKVESLAAIDLIVALPTKEVMVAPVTEAEAAEQFADGIMQLPARPSVQQINGVLRGNSVTLDPGVRKAVAALETDLRTPYLKFAQIYDRVDAGSYLASDAVKASREYGRELTAQLIAIAQVIDAAPPIFLERRSQFYIAVRAVRAGNASAEEKTRQLRLLYPKWQEVVAAENAYAEQIRSQCLKAALIGRQIDEMIDKYDRLSLDDINVLIARVLQAAGDVTGKDYGQVREQVAGFISDAQSDSVWGPLINMALNKANNAMAGRNPAPNS